jgi:hypothetical protein
MILNATNKQQLYVIKAGRVAAYSVLIIFLRVQIYVFNC